MSTTKNLGDQGEELAGDYLLAHGCTLLDRQWRCRYGELDLVARDADGTICFVEVKLRSGNLAGLPREAPEAGEAAGRGGLLSQPARPGRPRPV